MNNADTTTRENKTITIGAHTVIVKTYATAREVKEIAQAVYRGAKMEMVGDKPKISDFNFAATDEVEKEMITQLVISANGVTANIADYVLDNWKNDDYTALIEVLDDLTGKKK